MGATHRSRLVYKYFKPHGVNQRSVGHHHVGSPCSHVDALLSCIRALLLDVASITWPSAMLSKFRRQVKILVAAGTNDINPSDPKYPNNGTTGLKMEYFSSTASTPR